jgi:hypothetical protein
MATGSLLSANGEAAKENQAWLSWCGMQISGTRSERPSCLVRIRGVRRIWHAAAVHGRSAIKREKF